MNKQTEFPQDCLNILRDVYGKTNLQIKQIKQQLEDTTLAQQIWNDLNSYANREWFQHTLHLLKSKEQFFREASASDEAIKTALDQLARIAKENADTIFKRFPAYLEDAAIKYNLPLDLQSQDPKYTFEKGFFMVEIDYQSRMARLSDYEGRLEEFSADVNDIVDIVKREHDRVFGKPFDGNNFLKKLRNQYLAIVKKQNWPDGYAVPIRHITKRLGKNEEGFRTDVFVVQLSRLVEQGPTEIEGKQLDLQQTKDTNQGMLLSGQGGRSGYIGYITFKEVS